MIVNLLLQKILHLPRGRDKHTEYTKTPALSEHSMLILLKNNLYRNHHILFLLYQKEKNIVDDIFLQFNCRSDLKVINMFLLDHNNKGINWLITLIKLYFGLINMGCDIFF